ncbi:hypothetical protein JQ628_21435 [Bradyrhizobium lablabi]|uniref:hypothetical protein n=1 Tax=Bradyrhizobium lablabi TaxID=722472 RepID=UPI001BAD0ACB|nr:hypothetical protein [Bradyrhizobium lablabi]MBR1124107.1 hypothetical protein [Bradyrhizobium lablabi]
MVKRKSENNGQPTTDLISQIHAKNNYHEFDLDQETGQLSVHGYPVRYSRQSVRADQRERAIDRRRRA